MSYSTAQLQSIGQQAAAQNGIPWSVFSAQINQESGWNPNAYNASSGATGIAQFLPSTANNAGYGISAFDPTDPVSSLNAAAQYDAALQSANGGDLNAALSKYSGGAYTADSLTNGSYSNSGDTSTQNDTPSLTPSSGSTSSSGGASSYGSLFQEWFTRAAIVILAIGFLIVGVASLKNGSLTVPGAKLAKA